MLCRKGWSTERQGWGGRCSCVGRADRQRQGDTHLEAGVMCRKGWSTVSETRRQKPTWRQVLLVDEGLHRGQEHVDGYWQVHGCASVGALRPDEVELVVGVDHRLPVRHACITQNGLVLWCVHNCAPVTHKQGLCVQHAMLHNQANDSFWGTVCIQLVYNQAKDSFWGTAYIQFAYIHSHITCSVTGSIDPADTFHAPHKSFKHDFQMLSSHLL